MKNPGPAFPPQMADAAKRVPATFGALAFFSVTEFVVHTIIVVTIFLTRRHVIFAKVG